jgi:hypothetical protein
MFDVNVGEFSDVLNLGVGWRSAIFLVLQALGQA